MTAGQASRQKKDSWKAPRPRHNPNDRTGVPDAGWNDDEVSAWLEWWRPEEELVELCGFIGIKLTPGCPVVGVRTQLRDYYRSPVQGAPWPPLQGLPAVKEPEPEPELAPESESAAPPGPVGPALFGLLPPDCVTAVLDAGLGAGDLVRLAIAAPSLLSLLEDVAEERLRSHPLAHKAPPRRPPPSLSIWKTAPLVAQRDFSGNELPSNIAAQVGKATGRVPLQDLRPPLQILWELEGLASPLAFRTNPGLACSSVQIHEAGATVTSIGRQKAEALAATSTAVQRGSTTEQCHGVRASVAAAAAAGAAAGVSAVSSRAVMRSGTHCAEFSLLQMDERDGGRGIRIGISRRLAEHDFNVGAARTCSANMFQPQTQKISRAEIMGATVSNSGTSEEAPRCARPPTKP